MRAHFLLLFRIEECRRPERSRRYQVSSRKFHLCLRSVTRCCCRTLDSSQSPQSLAASCLRAQKHPLLLLPEPEGLEPQAHSYLRAPLRTQPQPRLLPPSPLPRVCHGGLPLLPVLPLRSCCPLLQERVRRGRPDSKGSCAHLPFY